MTRSDEIIAILASENLIDLGLRIDSDTHEKLKELAEYDGCSINGEVIYLIRQAIRAYEKEKDSVKKN